MNNEIVCTITKCLHSMKTQVIKRNFRKISNVMISIWQMTRLAWQAHSKAVIGLTILQILQGLFPVVVAWITKELFDLLTTILQGSASVDFTQRFLPLIIGQAILTLIGQLMGPLQAYLDAELNRNLTLTTQATIYGHISSLEGLAYFEQPAFHDTIRLASQGVQRGPSQILNVFTRLSRSLIILIGFFGILVFLSPILALAVAFASLPQLYIQLKTGQQRFGLMYRTSPKERQAFYFGNILSSITYAKEIRLFELGRYFLNRFLQTTREVQDIQRMQQLREMRWQLGLGVLSSIVAIGTFTVIILQAFAKQISLGDVTLYISALGSVQNALTSIIFSIGSLSEDILFFSHFSNLLALPPVLSVTNSPRPVPPLRHQIELINVSFRYSEGHPWILKNVNLIIPCNACLALVGLNGAGKTTLVKLLARLYDPTEGKILWDGIDIREFDPKEFRKRLGTIFQDFVHFDLTAQENIGVGNVDEIDNFPFVHQIASEVGIHNLLESLPNGYNTVLSRWLVEDGLGMDLSGGQWQKVAIARMFMRDADFLILDEPTAALDAKAELEIYRHFTSLVKGRTSLLISHRFSTIHIADFIAVLENGEITEYGKHNKLMKSGGTYAKLYQMQAEQYTH
ncbi:MAG: ABC transporter ATP-binding protein/permease [Anaerolineae bacterium]|nr:ABC transporter ATP-binding protein/permease [Anaerolineae bacterium]